jgi:glycosyltransferase involved in cell wall biosynthesis
MPTGSTDRPLTILQLTHQGFGAGSTQSILSLSAHLSRRGHRVLVGCPGDSLLARRVGEADGLELVPLAFRTMRGAANAVREAAAHHGVDVVNSHATRDRRACTWLRWRGRLPQGFVVTRRSMPRTLVPALVGVGLTADRTIAVSATVARGLRRRLHPMDRVRVVPNGIDLARIDVVPSPADVAAARAILGDTDGRGVILVAARRKDQDVLVAALSHVRHPTVLACVGIDADARLLRAARTVPSRHRVVFVPFTERPLAFYALAGVAALPSRIEGLSQALLEAMALGIPVIASCAGGNVDLVRTGVTGLLVSPRDPVAWAGAVDALFADAALAERLAQAARALVRDEFTLAHTAQRTEAVYREALTRRRLLRGEASR